MVLYGVVHTKRGLERLCYKRLRCWFNAVSQVPRFLCLQFLLTRSQAQALFLVMGYLVTIRSEHS